MRLAGLPGEPEMVLIEPAGMDSGLDYHGSPTVTVDGRDVDQREWPAGAAWG